MEPFLFTRVSKTTSRIGPPSFTERISTKKYDVLEKLLIQIAASLIAACRTCPKGEKPLPDSNVWQILAQGFEPSDFGYIFPQELMATQAWFIYNCLEAALENNTIVILSGVAKICFEALREYKRLVDWFSEKGFPKEDEKIKCPLWIKEFDNPTLNKKVFSTSD